jgi:ATPase subunit of ABC transporter with duplicated ATPase domains
VVSHDRQTQFCAHISDIDFSKINHYSGNYTFWYESNQLAATVQQNKSRGKETELEEFIRRLVNGQVKQATSRKKMISKLNISEINHQASRYAIIFF